MSASFVRIFQSYDDEEDDLRKASKLVHANHYVGTNQPLVAESAAPNSLKMEGLQANKFTLPLIKLQTLAQDTPC